MDKTLFSSALLRLIADNDRFYFPGFGVVCSEEQPAEIQENGIIQPPRRKVYIKESLDTDEKLLEAYMNLSGEDRVTALSEMEAYMREVRKALFATGSYELEGIGFLRINDEGVPCLEVTGNACLSADDFGFGKLALKELKREIVVQEPESQEPLVFNVEEPSPSPSAEPEREPEPEPEPEAVPDEPVAEPVEAPVEKVPEQRRETVEPTSVKPRKKVKTWLVVLLVGMALIMLFFALLIIFKDDIASAFTDIIYSQDDLDVIRRSQHTV